jgi:hypothetical protein
LRKKIFLVARGPSSDLVVFFLLCSWALLRLFIFFCSWALHIFPYVFACSWALLAWPSRLLVGPPQTWVKRICFSSTSFPLCFCLLVGPPLCPKQAARGPSPYVPYILVARPLSRAASWNGMTLASSPQASMQACLQPLAQRPRANVLPCTASDLARPKIFCSWALVGPPRRA